VKYLAERARALTSARAFFASRGYLEVETPIVIPSPGLDVHLNAFEAVATGVSGGRERFLSTSPEYQMKRLVADGHHRIFQITRAFRAGELGERHNPEFTILEFYRTANIEAIMRDTEQLIARITGGSITLGTGTARRTIDTRPPFLRMSLLEAFERFANTPPNETLRLAEQDEDVFFEKLAFEVEAGLSGIDRAVFVTDYPASQASLARKNPNDQRVAERFELYVAGVELCNGFGELTDATEQRTRFERDQAERSSRGKPVYPIDERFLEALVRGMPACSGNAIGFDRVVALACGSRSISDVLAFTDHEL
jgi:lysyl-tRNA synthetase class 2